VCRRPRQGAPGRGRRVYGRVPGSRRAHATYYVTDGARAAALRLGAGRITNARQAVFLLGARVAHPTAGSQPSPFWLAPLRGAAPPRRPAPALSAAGAAGRVRARGAGAGRGDLRRERAAGIPAAAAATGAARHRHHAGQAQAPRGGHWCAAALQPCPDGLARAGWQPGAAAPGRDGHPGAGLTPR